MHLIDTNIHIAYLLQNFEDDARTKDYLTVFNSISLANRVVPDFILGELETFMTKVVPPRYQLTGADKQKLDDLTLAYLHRVTTDCTLFVPDTRTLQRASELYFASIATLRISFFDSLLVATAEQNSFAVFSKDARVNELATKLHIPITAP